MKLVALNFFYQTGDYGYIVVAHYLKNLTGGNMASVGILAVLPFVATTAGIYVISALADKTGKRRLLIMISCSALLRRWWHRLFSVTTFLCHIWHWWSVASS